MYLANLLWIGLPPLNKCIKNLPGILVFFLIYSLQLTSFLVMFLVSQYLCLFYGTCTYK